MTDAHRAVSKPGAPSHLRRAPISTVAVTGATGYVGSHLCARLIASGFRVVPLVRDAKTSLVVPKAESPRSIGDLTDRPDWRSLLGGTDAVVHVAAAAHSHRLNSLSEDQLRLINTDSVLDVAEAAVANGLSRMVFVSSVGVYGPISTLSPATEKTPCRPTEPYAVAKRRAELGLMAGSLSRSVELAIVRPPMIYGPSCPGNLRQLSDLVRLGVPLPFASLDGRRNLLSIDSFCRAIARLLADEEDVSGLWNIAEPEELRVPEIVSALGQGLHGRPVRLVSVPICALSLAASLVRRAHLIHKLHAPVRIDGSRFRDRFSWSPTRSTCEGLIMVGRSFAKR